MTTLTRFDCFTTKFLLPPAAVQNCIFFKQLIYEWDGIKDEKNILLQSVTEKGTCPFVTTARTSRIGSRLALHMFFCV